MIQLHQLEGLYRVAKAGNYARAAREFPYPITQPGVHAQVRKLEEQLGVRLLEQIAKDRMVPTRAGQRLLDFATPFFEGLPDVLDAARQGGAYGRFRIEAGPLEIQEVLPQWVRRIRQVHPDIEIELRQIDVPVPERLSHEKVDLIVEHQVSLPSGVSSVVVGAYRTFFVLPSSHALSTRKRIGGRELGKEPAVVFHAGQPQRDLQLRALATLGAEPSRLIGAPSVASILAFVAAGLGYSLIPWPKSQGPRMRGVRAIPLTGPGTEFPILASFRQRREPDPVLDAVLRLAPSA